MYLIDIITIFDFLEKKHRGPSYKGRPLLLITCKCYKNVIYLQYKT